jgi:hypothetical protein
MVVAEVKLLRRAARNAKAPPVWIGGGVLGTVTVVVRNLATAATTCKLVEITARAFQATTPMS